MSQRRTRTLTADARGLLFPTDILYREPGPHRVVTIGRLPFPKRLRVVVFAPTAMVLMLWGGAAFMKFALPAERLTELRCRREAADIVCEWRLNDELRSTTRGTPEQVSVTEEGGRFPTVCFRLAGTVLQCDRGHDGTRVGPLRAALAETPCTVAT